MRRLIAFFFFFVFIKASSQPADSLTSNPYRAEDSLVNIYYTHQQHENLSVYNGRQFYGYPSSIQGHAFYRSNEWSRGSVLFDGLWYRDKGLMYDIYRDELIVKHPNGIHVILFSERIQQFIMEGQIFVYLNAGKAGSMMNGFYQQLTAGRATVYVKRVKQLEEKIDGLQVERKFIPADQFFIRKDSMFYPVRKQQDLMRVLNEKRQELSRYKNQENLKYKEGAERFIIRITEYYNQL